MGCVRGKGDFTFAEFGLNQQHPCCQKACHRDKAEQQSPWLEASYHAGLGQFTIRVPCCHIPAKVSIIVMWVDVSSRFILTIIFALGCSTGPYRANTAPQTSSSAPPPLINIYTS